MKFVITALVKTRDVIEADNEHEAAKRFEVKYPSMIDRDSQVLSIEKLVSAKDMMRSARKDLPCSKR